MKKIKLTQGQFALVENDDFEWLSQWKWHFNENGYARSSIPHKIYMHRIVNKTPKGKITDHINRNRLDNRKCNLRTISDRLNSINKSKQKNNTSGITGVSWSKSTKKWASNVWMNNRKINLGYFSNIVIATIIRKIGERVCYEI